MADTVLDITTVPVRVVLPATVNVLLNVTAPVADTVLDIATVPVNVVLPATANVLLNETAPVADTVLDITTAPVNVVLPVTVIVLEKAAAPKCEVVLEKLVAPITLRLPVIETLAENEALLPIITLVDKELAYICNDPLTNAAFDEILIAAGLARVPPLRESVITKVLAEKKPFTTALPVVTDPEDDASAVNAFDEII